MKYSSHENNKGVIVISSLGNRTKGVIYIIMSAFGFAMMSAFVKLAGDLPSFQKSFFRRSHLSNIGRNNTLVIECPCMDLTK